MNNPKRDGMSLVETGENHVAAKDTEEVVEKVGQWAPIYVSQLGHHLTKFNRAWLQDTEPPKELFFAIEPGTRFVYIVGHCVGR